MLEKLKKSFWFLQISGWLIYMVVIYITFLTVAANPLGLFYIKSFRAVAGFFLTIILWRIYRRMVNRFSLNTIVFMVLALSVIFGCLWAGIEELYFSLVSSNFNFSKDLPNLPKVALDYAMTITGWSAVYFGIKYWQKWQTEQENALQSAFLADKAQLEVLRYQLNPHFLFNALNSIRASVDEDKNRAKQMITQLSEFLRHSLLSVEKKEIPLHEEIEAVKNYLAIEKIRFEEKLEVNFEIDEEAEDFKVPCFLLNPLVENAIKHGLQTSPKPLKINISAKSEDEKLILEVANSGKLENLHNSNGTKIGLKNVRERLEKLFGGKSSFELKQNGDFVVAKIEISKAGARPSGSVSQG
ncbi:MAG: histidine kinase [Pyrinomonadaceae bacterium]|nr:histidine kinase [Pyrinomonadaceae bacterium]